MPPRAIRSSVSAATFHAWSAIGPSACAARASNASRVVDGGNLGASPNPPNASSAWATSDPTAWSTSARERLAGAGGRLRAATSAVIREPPSSS
jgi:hypothetical protein